jgi:hypothetical protein
MIGNSCSRLFNAPEISPAFPLFPRGSRTGEKTVFFVSGTAVRFGDGPSFKVDGRRRVGGVPEPVRAMCARAGEGTAFAVIFEV